MRVFKWVLFGMACIYMFNPAHLDLVINRFEVDLIWAIGSLVGELLIWGLLLWWAMRSKKTNQEDRNETR